MGTVTYPDSRVAEFINNHTIPVQMLYDAQPYASDYKVKWTPTIIILDQDGEEHHRVVGFLPPDEFIPGLLLGMVKVNFDRDQLDEAYIPPRCHPVQEYPQTGVAQGCLRATETRAPFERVGKKGNALQPSLVG